MNQPWGTCVPHPYPHFHLPSIYIISWNPRDPTPMATIFICFSNFSVLLENPNFQQREWRHFQATCKPMDAIEDKELPPFCRIGFVVAPGGSWVPSRAEDWHAVYLPVCTCGVLGSFCVCDTFHTAMRMNTLLTPSLGLMVKGERMWIRAHAHTNTQLKADGRAPPHPTPRRPVSSAPGPACDQTCFRKLAWQSPEFKLMSAFQPRPAGVGGLKSHPPLPTLFALSHSRHSHWPDQEESCCELHLVWVSNTYYISPPSGIFKTQGKTGER